FQTESIEACTPRTPAVRGDHVTPWHVRVAAGGLAWLGRKKQAIRQPPSEASHAACQRGQGTRRRTGLQAQHLKLMAASDSVLRAAAQGSGALDEPRLSGTLRRDETLEKGRSRPGRAPARAHALPQARGGCRGGPLASRPSPHVDPLVRLRRCPHLLPVPPK